MDISIGNLPDSTVPKISGFIPYYFMVSRGVCHMNGGMEFECNKEEPTTLGIKWGWVKTLVPSEPQNSWDLWMFIPLKMYL